MALAAAVDVLLNEGWDAVTQARVAELSGIGRATVYRYWPVRMTLVRDAVLAAHTAVRHHVELTDVLRKDVETELNNLRHELTETGLGTVLATLIDRAEWHPELDSTKRQITQYSLSVLRTILNHAQSRGQLVSGDVDACIAVLVGPLVFRRFVSGEPVTEEFVTWVADHFASPEGQDG